MGIGNQAGQNMNAADATQEGKVAGATPTPPVSRPAPTRETVTQQRIPFNGFTKRLEVFIPPDSPLHTEFRLYWFNDDRGRIQQALRAGYQFVQEDELAMNEGVTPRSQDTTGRVSRVVGAKSDGQAMSCFLMKIPKQIYLRDQEAHRSQIDATDAVIKRGGVNHAEPNSAYVPEGGIKYDPSNPLYHTNSKSRKES